jgi:hypothetical protein
LVIETKGNREALSSAKFVSADLVKKLNSSLRQPEYQTILREPIKQTSCPVLIPAKDGWFGLDWFSKKPNYEACVKFCAESGISDHACPCQSLFKRDQ